MINFGIMQGLLKGIPFAFSILMVINILIALTIIFLERKDSSAALAWLLVLFVLPVFGLILYLTFSQNISRRKIFKLTDAEEKFVSSALRKQTKAIENGEHIFSNQCGAVWKDLIRLNQVYGKSYFTENNNIELITDGKDKMSRLIYDIRNAVASINIEYFIIKGDRVGLGLISELTEAAKRGVDVRLLVDDLGSKSLLGDELNQFEEAGGKLARFFPVRFLRNSHLNYRNHRKIVVVDNHIGYVGGFNIAKEYLGQKKKFGYWRDTHLRIEGGGTQDLNSRFLMDWRFAANTNESIDMNKIFFPVSDHIGSSGMQIVSSGPDMEHEEVKRCFLKMITSAVDRICIQTPYFVPDETILEALKMAAQAGVDVKIMIPNKPDHMLVYWATYSYVGELMKDGVRVFVYDNGFLHAKTMVVDGEVATVGSTNFDRRSFKLNFETNAVIYDCKFSKELEDVFYEDLEKSYELTPRAYEHRSFKIKLKEPIARLLSDIL